MGVIVRVWTAMAVILGAALSAMWTWSVTVFTPLAAVTALMMGGTGHPLMAPDTDEYISAYLNHMADKYVQPALNRWSSGGDPLMVDRRVAVYTPEHFWPATGQMTFDDSVSLGVANLSACVSGGRCMHNPYLGDAPTGVGPQVVFGYSQSARIASEVKRALIDFYQQVDWAGAPELSFVVIGNPARPNGGVLQRLTGLSIPFFGISFNGAMPTDSTDSEGNQHLRTIDISKQYDAISDFPLYPLNLLATVNAVVGYFTEHGFYQESLDDPSVIDQGSHGDTDYYLIPAKQLPILKPFNRILPKPILTALDAPLRTIIELGYDRTLSPGTPAAMRLFRFTPVRDTLTVLRAVATGIDDGLAEAKGDPNFRPLRTKPVTGPFGVSSVTPPTGADPAEARAVRSAAIERTARRDRGALATVRSRLHLARGEAPVRADRRVRPAAESGVKTKDRRHGLIGLTNRPERGPARVRTPRPAVPDANASDARAANSGPDRSEPAG